jgi:delta1-piperideine-2-carboxylate reductase
MISRFADKTTASFSEPQINVPLDELIGLLGRILSRYGASASVAAELARNCAAAEADGTRSHGIFRIPGYVSTLKSGWVDGHAEPVINDNAPGVIAVDACNGFAQPALALAAPRLVERARAGGIAMACLRDSHHFGALWLDVEPFATKGFIALSCVNAIARVVPHGGRKPVFGTNPMAFAVPRTGQLPLVFDQASSAMANGDLRLAAQEQRSVDRGAGVDRDGEPTTDPAAIIDGGALLPFGGHKGSSIALMIEVLAAALTGGQFSFEVKLTPGAETPRTGQMVLLIDPAKGGGALFGERIETLITAVKAGGATRLPSERRYERRRQTQLTGVPLSRAEMDKLSELLAG